MLSPALRRILFRQSMSEQAQQFISRTIALDSRHQNAATTLINNLVQQGIWQLLDGFWVFATQDQTNAFLNWVSSKYPVGLTAAGATFTPDQGFTPTSSSVMNPGQGGTTYVPSTQGVNLTLNSASIGHYCLTLNNTTCYDCGGGSTANLWLSSRDAGTQSFFAVNDTDNTAGSATGAAGLIVATRTDSSNKTIFGPTGSPTAFRTQAAASTALANGNIYFGARNAGGINNPATTRQYAMGFVGGGLLGPQYAALSFFVNQYMKTMGCNVY